MALIDKASLLMVPSTYEAGTLYNVLPSGNRAPDNKGGAGYDQTRADFTFDRGSNAAATRIGSDGLIKKYRENLLLQSNQFDTTWSTNNASVTGGQSGYDGLNNAWELKENTSTGVHEIIQTLSVSAGVQTYSLKVSANTRSKMALVLAGSAFNSGGNGVGIFNLTNGTLISSSGSLIDAKITSLGGNWYNVSITKFASSSSAVAVIQLVDDSNNTSYTGNGTGNIYIQNAQLESGLVSTDVLTSGATTAKAGVLIDLPRINYDANGENGSLLLEPQRTNLITQSEYFGASDWVKTGLTIASNQVMSPDGNLNGTEVTISNGSHFLFDIISVSPSTTYTFSWYAKRGTATNVSYSVYDDTNSADIIPSTSYYSQLSDTEWKRISIQFTTSATTTSARPYVLRDGGQTGTISIYGAQLEEGSYVSSYIPNHSGTGGVTRAADSCSVTGASDILNDSEGTLFAEFEIIDESTTESYPIAIYGTGATIQIYYRSTSQSISFLSSVGSIQYLYHSSVNPLGRHKVALVYQQGKYSAFIDGVLVNTQSSGNVPSEGTLNTLNFGDAGAGRFYGNAKQLFYFNSALTDAECITLTTL